MHASVLRVRERIADEATDGATVRLALAYQPMASADVAEAVAITIDAPRNGVHEVGGPEMFRLDELISTALAARNDRTVAADPDAGYWGARSAVHDPGEVRRCSRHDSRIGSSGATASITDGHLDGWGRGVTRDAPDRPSKGPCGGGDSSVSVASGR